MKSGNKIEIIRKILFLFCASVLLSVTSYEIHAQTKRKLYKPKIQKATVIINQNGYRPSSLRLKRGIPARVTFLRKTDTTCGTEVLISAYSINRKLPLNEAVVIAFTPKNTGELVFTCGMDMLRGKLIVR